LTPRHLNILKRYSDNLVLAFDMDLAGDTATKRGINLAESLEFNIKIIETYKGGKDPAEIILESPENWRQLLSKARAIMDYYFDSAFSSFDKSAPEGKKEIGKIILPAIKRIQNKIEQSHWIQKLAEKLGVKEEAVLEELKNAKTESAYSPAEIGRPPSPTTAVGATASQRKKLLEEKIIALAVKNPESLNFIEDRHCNLFYPKTKNLIEELRGGAVFADISKKEEYKELFDTLALRVEAEYEEDLTDDRQAEEEIQLCLSELKGIELRNTLNNMLDAIKRESDEQKKEELIKEFDKKAKELHQKS